MLSPKIHRNSMLPPRCPQPPCRNIEVSRVVQNGNGMCGGRSTPAAYSRGTTPQAKMNPCSASSGLLISLRKARTFSAISAIVTNAMPLCSFSSPIGSIESLRAAPDGLRRQQPLREFCDDGVVRIDDVGDADDAGLGGNLVGVHLVEAVIRDQPLDQLDIRDAEGVDERPDAAGDHDVLVVLDARPADAPALDQIELERDVGGGLEAGSGDLAVALQGMEVAKIEQGAGMEHREVDGRAWSHIRRVHVAAEVSGPEPFPDLLARRCDGNPAEHRLQRHLD